MTRRSLIVLLTVALLATGCGQKATRDRVLDTTLKAYGKLIRWNEFERALVFLDPERVDELKPKGLDWERYSQVKVSGYQEAPPVTEEDGTVTVVVRVEVYNVHTLKERSLVDRQRWRFDEEKENWFLTTGLPRLVE
jgi:hypothetical protein